jgi:two-component system cell cycle response regulator
MKVLISDDDAISRLLLKNLLVKWGYEVVETSDGSRAWEILQEENAPRLAILDWMMPGMTGPEICRETRKRLARPYTYFLLVTSREEKNDVVQGLEAGADDYLAKPIFPGELEARLRVGLRILELEDQLVASREVLQYRATHDVLTGLLNRYSVCEFLKRELIRAQRTGETCGVLLADVDHFKSVNDTYGHEAGDIVLREVAIRLRAGIREYDAVGRYGGEEFLIVLAHCDEQSLRVRAEHIIGGFRAQPFHAQAHSLPVTISAGAVSSATMPNSDVDSIIRAADDALYTAKRNGRDRAEVSRSKEARKLSSVS